jgi:hypothetical protein
MLNQQFTRLEKMIRQWGKGGVVRRINPRRRHPNSENGSAQKKIPGE